MSGYYDDRLSAERLRTCYEVAPPAVRAYLDREVEFVVSRLSPSTRVLELGCGYGRVLTKLAPHAHSVWGIDTSVASLEMAAARRAQDRFHLAAMDATRMAFRAAVFDVVVCIQNGISAFAVDQDALVREAVRVTHPGGRVLFSSYAERFWASRLEWFEVQAAHGLIGEIDPERTGNGVIVCRDGFRATTVDPNGFLRLAAGVGIVPVISEVAGSSVFCELVIPSDS